MYDQYGLIEEKSAAFADEHEPDVHGGHSNLSNPVDITVKPSQERKRAEEALQASKTVDRRAGREDRPMDDFKKAGKELARHKTWLYVCAGFILLCVFSLFNELLDLPHILLGSPQTSINWTEAAIEIVFIAIVAFFSVALLIREVAEHKQSEKNLQSERYKLKAIFDGLVHTEIGIDIVGIDYKILLQSPLLQEKFGDCTGKLCYESYMGLKEPCDFCPMTKAVRNNKIESVELTAKDGRDYELLSAPFPNPDGTIDKVIEVVHDITARRQAEEALRKSESNKALILSSISELMVYQDKNLRIVWANKAAADSVGQSVDELIGRYCYKVWCQRDEPCSDCPVRKSFETGRPQESEVSTPDGRIRHIRSYPVRDQNGDVAGAVEVTLDITERKEATKKLKLLSSAVEQAGEGIAVIDMQDNILSANNSFAGMHGYTEEELIGKHISIFHTAEQMPSVEAANRQTSEKGWFSGEIGHVRRNGRVFPTWMQNSLLRDEAGNPVGIIATLRDITQLKLAERRIRLNESRLQSLLTLSQMAEAPVQEITDFALESAIKLTNSKLGYVAFMNEDETVLTMHSWSKEAMAQYRMADKPIVYPVEATGLWGEAVRQRKPIITNDYAADNPLKKGYPEGHVDVIRHMNIPVFDNGRIVAVAGVGNKDEEYDESDVRQLTLLMLDMWKLIQRKQAEEAIGKSEEKYRALSNEMELILDHIPALIFYKDTENNFVRVNKYIADAHKMSKAEFEGKSLFDLYSQKDAQAYWDDDSEVIKSGKPKLFYEESWQTPEGTKWVSTSKIPHVAGNGEIAGIVGFSIEITERKQAEEQVRQSRVELERISRIITIGEMASGLAHELNQPLCAILNYANGCLRMIRTETASSDKLLAAIEQIATQADRGGKITQRVRDLVGRREPHLSTVDINEIVRDVVSLEVAELTQADVALQLELAGDMPLILADKIEIEQTVLNLVKNGIEAMSDTAIDRRQLTIQTSTAGSDAVQFAVRDMGKGLPPEGADKIFDPFFTTKPDGLGMGLSISRSIIKAHGGKLWAQPNPDTGTTFQFTLPLKGKENG